MSTTVLRTAPQVALITGGGRGIGRLVASALADNGIAVGLIARSATDLEETVTAIESAGGIAASAVADVTDAPALESAIRMLRDDLGPVDMLVNNAGVMGPVGPFWENDLEAWWRTMDVNLRGTLLPTQLVLPEMIHRRRGRIINLSSQAGVFRWPLMTAYSVSKAAVTKFSENLARETLRHGISVFSVHPGLLPLGMSEGALADRSVPDSHEERVFAWVRNEIASGRGAEPGRAVAVIVALALGRYDELTGRQLEVHDDLDALASRIDEIRDDELYVLGVHKLPAASERDGWRSVRTA